MVYKNSKKGAQGIGTLIIFIALILVAAVAAGVLISTVGKLQGKAENTGSEIQQRLGTGFSVIEVLANDTSDSIIHSTDTISTTLQLSPGSDPIKISDITMTIVTNSGIQSFDNSQFLNATVSGDLSDGYINKGDVATLTIAATYNISENEEFTIRIFPGSGNPIPIALVTPPTMTSTYTVLK